MNIAILKTETTEDPLVRGYAGMTDKQVAVDMNIIYRKTNKASLTGSEVLNAIPDGVLDALPIEEQEKVWRIIHMANINPFGAEATMFTTIFGVGSVTIDNLQALRVNHVSRGVELGSGVVKEGYIEMARRQ